MQVLPWQVQKLPCVIQPGLAQAAIPGPSTNENCQRSSPRYGTRRGLLSMYVDHPTSYDLRWQAATPYGALFAGTALSTNPAA
jgi:hypothetical protein